VYCLTDGGTQTASDLPDAVLVESATAAPGPGVTYALAATDRRLVRLTIDRTGNPSWRPGDTIGSRYVSVFTGRAISDAEPNPKPYEWQLPFYGADPRNNNVVVGP
jgi:hypothetical protein